MPSTYVLSLSSHYALDSFLLFTLFIFSIALMIPTEVQIRGFHAPACFPTTKISHLRKTVMWIINWVTVFTVNGKEGASPYCGKRLISILSPISTQN
ncbi:hypothetical protein MA16_Dca019407 [Dendrobium catenatum]|uniref:Uncharacterized protein n=1 Tax=Dendrobium catenatum TaxID=906689 RepID=A0A2I0WRU9_9ASPA|nr:hypothetical protein MA16_Dca019407 [Dendrobium catenatum]